MEKKGFWTGKAKYLVRECLVIACCGNQRKSRNENYRKNIEKRSTVLFTAGSTKKVVSFIGLGQMDY
jgi:hypothetical protein